jgi:hypothetical protein
MSGAWFTSLVHVLLFPRSFRALSRDLTRPSALDSSSDCFTPRPSDPLVTTQSNCTVMRMSDR